MEKGSSSSCSSGSGGGGADSINGLNFGKKIYLAGSGSGLRPEEAPTSPAKKGRTAVMQGGQPPQCQVEGCKADLSDAKAYYCRHKVCGAHSKSPRVIVAGLEQRFCQQCSRFHQLPEFDQGKRSCRRRLAGHNERRRKPPPAPLLPSCYGTLSPSTYDKLSSGGSGFMMDFSSYSSNVSRIDSWANMSADRGIGNQSGIPQKYDLPWPTNSHNPLPNLLQSLNPPPPPPEGTFNPSALSLLSNASWAGSRTQPQALDLGTNNFLGPTVGQFPWGPLGGFTGSGIIHDSTPDMGLAAFSESSSSQFNGVAQSSNEHYQDETEQSRGYDSPVQQMHWSL